MTLGAWYMLRVEFSGRPIVVLLNGKRTIYMDDSRITGSGKVGVWTKADSVTVFDDFRTSVRADNVSVLHAVCRSSSACSRLTLVRPMRNWASEKAVQDPATATPFAERAVG